MGKSYVQLTEDEDDGADTGITYVNEINVTASGSARVGPYYPGKAKSIVVASTGAAKLQVRGGGGSGLEDTNYRDLKLTTEDASPTASVAGLFTEACLPHEFYILDTSGSTNKITMYINF